MIPTPHIEARKEDIAKVVLMPGDPLRAKYIAEKYLENVKLVNSVRNCLFYTGTYNGKAVTVAASGMGYGSMNIYSYELFSFYDVETIIRVGTCGGYKPDLDIYSVILATESFTDCPIFASHIFGESTQVIKPSEEVNNKLRESAKNLGITLHEGRFHSCDIFYSCRNLEDMISQSGAAVVEMESFSLFSNAKRLGKKAACICTVSDNLISEKFASHKERETKFDEMMRIALGVV